MPQPRVPSGKTWGRMLLNGIMIVILLLIMAPIALAVIISFKDQQDTIRKPPVLFPCDTPTNAFDLGACRWAVEGYERRQGIGNNGVSQGFLWHKLFSYTG